ncbi:MAG TPA: hypothetical protein VHD34_01440 [Xanthobacteraceae bacterium]|nr:hypothetical protein [Xanthobacteraceae bacterium]
MRWAAFDSIRRGGFRSWLELPELDSALVSVISDEEHARRCQHLEELLG